MRSLFSLIIASSFFSSVDAAEIPSFFTDPPKETVSEQPSSVEKPITPFTGRVTRAKVRLRTQSTIDSPIVKELEKGDLLVIDAEKEDFYAVRPLSDIKSYVFRTFVLDNIVEGTRVNVRLFPNLDAPVVAQLNSGDRVRGQILQNNNKWLEIDPPATVRFYVSKEFVERAGDEQYQAQQEKRKNDAQNLIRNAQNMSQTELQKPFDQIQLQPILSQYQLVIDKYSDFQDLAKKAEEQIGVVQKVYTDKRIAFLEQKAKQADILSQQQKLISANQPTPAPQQVQPQPPSGPTDKMNAWKSLETNLINQWRSTGHQNGTEVEFYAQEKDRATILRGMIEPYQRPVVNRPGDYMLVSASDNRPLAYLYSTKVNLQNYVGHEVSIWAVPRPNNQFAFPAYFVIELQ